MTEEVIVSPIGLADFEGRASIRAFFEGAFEALTVSAYSFTVTEAEIHGNTAYDRGTFVWESAAAGQAPVRSVGRYSAVRHRGADGVWRIHRLIENEVSGN